MIKNKLKAIIPAVILIIASLAGINLGNFIDTNQEPLVKSQINQSVIDSIEEVENESTQEKVSLEGNYYSKEEVALFIHKYNRLPNNYITKSQARDLGWEGGSVEEVAPGKSIGGDTFKNLEGKLPKKTGRTYKECDIDTLNKKSRGAKRIVFSNDGLIYYTDDHYETFLLLYGEE